MANQLDVRVDVAVQGADDLQRVGTGFDEAATKSSKFGSVAQGAMIGVASAVTGFGIGLAQQGISAAIDAIGDSITLASDKAEAASKAQVLFGDSYQLVADKANTAATDVGVSSGKYLELAGNVGNLVTNFGFAGDEAANMSTDIVQLSADVGSFNNAPTEDVVNAIGSAFRGETEPIRAFGVMLDDASVKAKAMSLGLYDGVGALDKNAKATATYQLILEQTTKAQGDFARTSDGLANSQRIAQAKVDDSLTHLGEVLYPIAATLVPMFADALSGAIDFVVQIADAIKGWVDNNRPLIDGIQSLIGTLADLYGRYLSFIFGILGQIADQFLALAGILSGPFHAALDIIGAAIRFFVDGLGALGDGLNNVHRFIDPNFAALDDLGKSFIAAGEAAGLSAEQSNQAWADAQASAKAGGDAATQSMDVYIASWKAANVATSDAAGGIANSADDVTRALDLIGAGSQNMAATVGPNLQKVGFDLFGFAKQANDWIATQNWMALGAMIPSDIGKGIADASHQVLDAADNLVKLLKEGMSPAEEAAKLTGAKYTKAVASGMTSEIPGAKEAAQAVAIKAIGTIEGAANGTPSTKGLAAIGQYYDTLLAGGMDAHAIAVALAGDGVAGDVIQKLTGYYPVLDNTGKVYDAKLAGGISSADGQINTAVVNATDPLHQIDTAKFGDQVGDAWVKSAAHSISGGRSQLADAAWNAFSHLIGSSPPKDGPLHNVDVWGANIGHAWIGGIVDAIDQGGDQLSRAAGGIFPTDSLGRASLELAGGGAGARAGITVNVYAGVGDPVAIGRQVSETLAAYQRASGTEA